MKAPIYLPMRDRLVLRHAAKLLDDEAEALKACNSIDGVIVELPTLREYGDLRATSESLRRIARNRTNKEAAK